MIHHTPQRRRLCRSIALALTASIGVAAMQAQANTITVDSTADNVVADGHCTLREAIDNATEGFLHSDCAQGLGYNSDTIVFAPALMDSTITLSAAAGELRFENSQDTIVTGDINGDGNADITLSGNDQQRVINIYNSATSVTLENIVISNGYAAFDDGGGIINNGYLTLDKVTVRDNMAGRDGGGIHSTGTVDIRDSTITGNSADRGGGVFTSGEGASIERSTISDNVAQSAGGGIANFSPLTLSRSTISGNTAWGTGGGMQLSQQATIVNATIHGNTAYTGGGISVSNDNVTLRHVTLAGNHAFLSAGGMYQAAGITQTRFDNVVIAGNTRGNDNSNCDGYGVIENTGENLAWPTPGPVCNVTAVTVGNPQLGSLRWNGGTTRTMLPQPGSEAVDSAPCLVGSNAVDIDQRDMVRPWPVGSLCDFGAVEVSAVDLDRIFADGFE